MLPNYVCAPTSGWFRESKLNSKVIDWHEVLVSRLGVAFVERGLSL